MSPPQDIPAIFSQSSSDADLNWIKDLTPSLPAEFVPGGVEAWEGFSRLGEALPAVAREVNTLWQQRLPRYLQSFLAAESPVARASEWDFLGDFLNPVRQGILVTAGRDIQRTAELSWGAYLMLLAAKNREDPRSEVSIRAFIDDYRHIGKLEPEARAALWPLVLERLRKDGISLPEDSMESYEAFVERMGRYGEHFSERVRSLRTAAILMHNRDTYDFGPGHRRLAVVIEAARDHNGALTVANGFPLLDRLLENKRFDLLYFEVEEEAGIRNALTEVRLETGRRVHSLVTAGHGMPTALALGSDDPMIALTGASEETVLDTEDFRAGEFDFLDEVMEPEGQVLLLACYAGAGHGHVYNLANAHADVLRGRRVYSIGVPSNIWSLDVDEDYSFKVGWTADAENAYAVTIPVDAPEEIVFLSPQNGRHDNGPTTGSQNSG